MLRITTATATDRGGRSRNEDSLALRSFDQKLAFVVADGAGGHGGGDIASKLAVQSFLKLFAKQPASNAQELAALVKEVNRLILRARIPRSASQDMHSTLTVLAMDTVRRVAYWAHVGDTRLYHFRGRSVVAKTCDHSLVQALVAAGLLDPALANDHARRSTLTSSLGMDEEDLLVSAIEADVGLEPGDRFLLCTDGLWEHLSDPTLLGMLEQAASPQDWLDRIRRQILDAVQTATNHDNFSAIAIWLDT